MTLLMLPPLVDGLLAALAYGVLGIVLMTGGFLLFDAALTRIDIQKELAEKNNISVAIVAAALILAIAWIIGHAIGG